MPTHGSLTKAGKVRDQSPKRIWREAVKKVGKETKIVKLAGKKAKCPRLRVRRNYEKRILMKQVSGQNYAA